MVGPPDAMMVVPRQPEPIVMMPGSAIPNHTNSNMYNYTTPYTTFVYASPPLPNMSTPYGGVPNDVYDGYLRCAQGYAPHVNQRVNVIDSMPQQSNSPGLK